jgi:hypothetical protein
VHKSQAKAGGKDYPFGPLRADSLQLVNGSERRIWNNRFNL